MKQRLQIIFKSSKRHINVTVISEQSIKYIFQNFPLMLLCPPSKFCNRISKKNIKAINVLGLCSVGSLRNTPEIHNNTKSS